MKTKGTQLTDSQIADYKRELKRLLKIKDYEITDLQYLPYTGKFSACIEVKFAGRTRICQTARKSIIDVANDLQDQYAGMIFCVGAGGALRTFSQKIERYFLQ